jgi:hypothetical protein
VGAGVETRVSSVTVWANGTDVSILSAVETLGVAVAGVGLSEGSEIWHSVGLAQAVVELAAEVVLNLMGCVFEHAVGIGGLGVNAVVDPSMMLGVVVGAEGDLPVANGLEGAKGDKVALSSLGHDDLIVVLILNGNGNVSGEPVPIGFNVVFKCLIVNVDVGVGGRLDDITGEGVGDAFEWKDGEGIGVMDHTVYDLCVHEKMS